MAFPRKLLAPDEEVVLETRPALSVLSGPVVMLLFVVAASLAIALTWPSAPVVVSYLLAAACALATLYLLGQVASWRARLLVATTSRVIYRYGVLRRTGREIPLQRIQDVTYHQSIGERLLRTGSITIESAGSQGQEPFPDVRRPAEVQSLINRLATGDRSWRPPEPLRQEPLPPPPVPAAASKWVPAPRSDPPTSEIPVILPTGTEPASTTAAAGSLVDELRELEHLHEAGVLTDAEFHWKRRQALGLD